MGGGGVGTTVQHWSGMRFSIKNCFLACSVFFLPVKVMPFLESEAVTR